MTAPCTGFQYDLGEYKANGLSSLLIDIKDSIIRKVRKEFPICYWYSVGLIHTYKDIPLMTQTEYFKKIDRRVFKGKRHSYNKNSFKYR